MKEVYYLNKETLPRIPVPHDCLIREVALKDGFLEFTFEDDINLHDSIQAIKPEAKSLIIRYHLIYDLDDIEIIFLESIAYHWWARDPYAHKCHYRVFDYKKLPELTKDGSLSYNAHYVNYNAMFIRLSSRCSIHIELFADYVEYEWIC